MSVDCFVRTIEEHELDKINSAIHKWIDEDNMRNTVVLKQYLCALHFVVSGSAKPVPLPATQRTFLKGIEVGPDIGYGKVIYQDANLTAKIADYLENLPTATILERSEAEMLNRAGVYPGGWDANDSARIRSLFSELRLRYMSSREGNGFMTVYFL